VNLIPRSLFARLMAIWLVGIALVLAASFALFVGERERVGRAALFEGVAQEVATTADVLDHLAPSERAARIEELGRRRLRLSLGPFPSHARQLDADHPFSRALQEAMPERRASAYLLPRSEHSRGDHHRGDARFVLLVSVRLADGAPLNVYMPGIPPQPEFRAPAPARLLAALVALVGGVLALSWIAVRLATRPLRTMAEAANRLGDDPERAAPLPTGGPTEVGAAATAFNRMQQRVREHIRERTRILAAISHDLQTPVTRLRLRAEQIDDVALRQRFNADLDAMQTLIREGLDFARSRDDATPLQPVDIDGLLDAITEDAREMGWQVAVSGRAGRPCPARPPTLRRALWNIVENGIKFGERVEIIVHAARERIVLEIRDHGPGMAEDDLEKVFEPFCRTESSRNRDTGGTGLGLAIARNLLRTQGGEVRLSNHPDGGLIARVTLGATADQKNGHP
tara:strand:- start:282 stop:1649 length:1368 start_codon:yes stop_codon:yes gene_type:complete